MREVRRALLSWYRETRRDLPWRRTRDPYQIWVAETMLQQTSSNSIFLAALAANALDSKPPLGIFRRFVVEQNGIGHKRLQMPATDHPGTNF